MSLSVWKGITWVGGGGARVTLSVFRAVYILPQLASPLDTFRQLSITKSRTSGIGLYLPATREAEIRRLQIQRSWTVMYPQGQPGNLVRACLERTFFF